MSENCSNCGCDSSNDNCGTKNISEAELEEILQEKKNHSRKYSVEYRIELGDLNCSPDEFIDRIKAYAGIVDEVEFGENELIISYDDRLITPTEISHLIN